MMRITLVIAILAMLVAGCTTMREMDLPPNEVQARIRAGEIARPGERISVTTAGGKEHVLVVVESDDQVIRGASARVPIDEIVSVRTEHPSIGKTAAAVGGSLAVLYVIGSIYVASLLF